MCFICKICTIDDEKAVDIFTNVITQEHINSLDVEIISCIILGLDCFWGKKVRNLILYNIASKKWVLNSVKR